MSGKQRAVIWMGLILIAFNLARRWKDISAIIFSGAGAGGTTTSPGSGNTGGGHSVTIPIDPFLPTGPKITIPLP
jgi:hypothetical protein